MRKKEGLERKPRINAVVEIFIKSFKDRGIPGRVEPDLNLQQKSATIAAMTVKSDAR